MIAYYINERGKLGVVSQKEQNGFLGFSLSENHLLIAIKDENGSFVEPENLALTDFETLFLNTHKASQALQYVNRSEFMPAGFRVVGEAYLAETIAYRDRVLADGGTIRDIKKVDAIFNLLKKHNYLNNVLGIYGADLGIKKDSLNKVSKMYSVGSSKDLIQPLGANQPTYQEPVMGRHEIYCSGTESMYHTFTPAVNLTEYTYLNFFHTITSASSGVSDIHRTTSPYQRIHSYYTTGSAKLIVNFYDGTTSNVITKAPTVDALEKTISTAKGTNLQMSFDNWDAPTIVTLPAILNMDGELSLTMSQQATPDVLRYPGKYRFNVYMDIQASSAFIKELVKFY